MKTIKPNLPPCPDGFQWKLMPHNAIIKEHDIVVYGNEVVYTADPISHIGYKCSVTLGRVYRKFPIRYRYFLHKSGRFGANHKVLRFNPSNDSFDFIVTLDKVEPHSTKWSKSDIETFIKMGNWIEISYDEVVKKIEHSNVEKSIEALHSKIEKLKFEFNQRLHEILLDVGALDFDLFFGKKK